MSRSALLRSLVVYSGFANALLLTGTNAEETRAAERFVVTVQRLRSTDGLISGVISVNGEPIGTFYENEEKKIPAGKYKGRLRYTSGKNFVQGPGGKLGRSGDFLLEVGDVPGRTDILFHAGNKKEHSEGCIMLGPATQNAKGDRIAPEPLKKLRLLFYDNQDMPSSTPNKDIDIEVRNPEK
jgi:hypothetical protein